MLGGNSSTDVLSPGHMNQRFFRIADSLRFFIIYCLKYQVTNCHTDEMCRIYWRFWARWRFVRLFGWEYMRINVDMYGFYSMGKAFPGRFIFFLAKDVYGHSQITLIYYLASLPNVTLPFMGKNTIELIIIPLRWYMCVFPIIWDMV